MFAALLVLTSGFFRPVQGQDWSMWYVCDLQAPNTELKPQIQVLGDTQVILLEELLDPGGKLDAWGGAQASVPRAPQGALPSNGAPYCQFSACWLLG